MTATVSPYLFPTISKFITSYFIFSCQQCLPCAWKKSVEGAGTTDVYLEAEDSSTVSMWFELSSLRE